MASCDDDLLDEEQEHFRIINEKSVDDITLAFFYKPHTITLLTAKKILMPDKFIWNDKSQLLFEAALNSHQRRSCIYAVTPWRAHRQVKKIKNK
jgi:hypothetical protein